MGKERFAREPLLYIKQIDGYEAHAKMQYQYMGKRNRNDTSEAVEAEHMSEMSRKRKKESFSDRIEQNLDKEIQQETPEEKGKDVKNEKTTPSKENKRFRDMSLKEKIAYLAEKPTYAPRITCEIKTKEQVYRGIVLSYQKDIVTIQRVREQLELPIEEITEINLLSL